MVEIVKFFVKKNSAGKKIIHSICRTTKGKKSIFPKSCQDLKFHASGVRDKVENHPVTTKGHVDYSLKGNEIYMYINPANGKFWWNKQELPTKAAKDVSDTPSVDLSELPANSSEASPRLVRQNATTDDIAEKIAACKDIAQVVELLETKLSPYNPRIDFPNVWVLNFENIVQNGCSTNLEGRRKTQPEMEECFFSLFGCFLSRKQGSWFWQHRQQNPAETWADFKRNFISVHWKSF